MSLPTQLEKWISHDLKNLANKTINELLIILRGIMKTAKADRLIDYNSMEDIDKMGYGRCSGHESHRH